MYLLLLGILGQNHEKMHNNKTAKNLYECDVSKQNTKIRSCDYVIKL